jgi:hypothetical protein
VRCFQAPDGALGCDPATARIYRACTLPAAAAVLGRRDRGRHTARAGAAPRVPGAMTMCHRRGVRWC